MERDQVRNRKKSYYTQVENEIMDSMAFEKPIDKLLYCCLCRFTFGDSPAYPSIDTLCMMTGVTSKNTIRASLKRLDDLDLITIEKRPKKNGENETNIYWLEEIPTHVIVSSIRNDIAKKVHKKDEKERKKEKAAKRGSKNEPPKKDGSKNEPPSSKNEPPSSNFEPNNQSITNTPLQLNKYNQSIVDAVKKKYDGLIDATNFTIVLARVIENKPSRNFKGYLEKAIEEEIKVIARNVGRKEIVPEFMQEGYEYTPPVETDEIKAERERIKKEIEELNSRKKAN